MRTALVTGGARRIGRAIVERLASAGYAVAIHCHRSDHEAHALKRALQAKGARAEVVAADLADGAALAALVRGARTALGPLTLLVNNASAFEPDDIHSLDEALWERHFRINLRAPVFLARDFAKQVREGGEGAIVNVVDQRVWKPTPQFFSYTLSKSALFTATLTMAQALAPRIRVNAVGPGPTLASSRQRQDDFARQGASVPLGHGPRPEEIAEAVLFLANAKSVTGQIGRRRRAASRVGDAGHAGCSGVSLARDVFASVCAAINASPETREPPLSRGIQRSVATPHLPSQERNMPPIRTSILAAAVILSGAAHAQPASKPTDPQIAHIAYTAGQIDIKAAELARKRSKSKEVRAFANDMLRDHKAVNAQALALLKKLNVTPEDNGTSRALTQQANGKLKEMRTLKGAAFDKAYAQNEVTFHQQVNTALETTLIPSAINPELKDLLSTGLRIFQGHQQHAEHLVQGLR